MDDIFLSFGFRLAVWLLLTASALGVLAFYWFVRRREKHIDLSYNYQDLIRLCQQKQDEKNQLEARIRDFDERRTQRDRWHSEEVRARDWLQQHEETVREIKDYQEQLGSIRTQFQEAQTVVSQLQQSRQEQQHLNSELEHLRNERDKCAAEFKEISNAYVSLLKETDQRKAQLESLTDQFRSVSEERARAQVELKHATEEYIGVSQQLENRRTELVDIDTELDQLRARAERFKMDNPFLADHQERIQQQWKSLEGQYQEAIARNRQQWQHLEDQFKRLRDQTQRSSTSLSL